MSLKIVFTWWQTDFWDFFKNLFGKYVGSDSNGNSITKVKKRTLGCLFQ